MKEHFQTLALVRNKGAGVSQQIVGGGGAIQGPLLIHDDSIKLLAEPSRFEPGSIDLILTDPPWNITACSWERKLDLPAMFAGFSRVLKPNGAVVIFSQIPFTIALANAANAARLPLRYEWVWDKRRVTGFLNAKRIPLRRHESILVFYRSLPTYNPQGVRDAAPKRRGSNSEVYRKVLSARPGTRSGFPTSILTFPPTPGAKPCQKPVELLKYLIRTYSRDGETVLDPFLGTGSCGVACEAVGRRFIGIEIDRARFDAASLWITAPAPGIAA